VRVRAWLHERRPAPPATLLARLEEVLDQERNGDEMDIVFTALTAATNLLEEIVARPAAGRECALDLLTADALVTYAFEVASDDPEGLASRAATALRQFAAVGADPSAKEATGC